MTNPIFAIASYPPRNVVWLEISAEGSITSDEQDDFMVQTRVKLYVKSGYSAYFDNVVIEEL